MIKIKLNINSPKAGLLRQSPNGDGIWGNYQFFINEDVPECDFWIVYSKGIDKYNECFVSPENIYLITGEPESVYHYAKRFVNNFSKVLTSRKDISHNNVISIQPAQPWWVGRLRDNNGNYSFRMCFKELQKPVENKTKLISIIASSKSFTSGHQERLKFVSAMKAHFGEKLDVFGRGINGFDDKWDTLYKYKYHIVIENSSYPNYWTEKLADCFLAECFPFYYGCSNLEDYFHQESFVSIDISKVGQSIAIIEKSIQDDIYSERLEAIRRSKNDVMFKHNIFPMIISHLEDKGERQLVSLKNEKRYFDSGKFRLLANRIVHKLMY